MSFLSTMMFAEEQATDWSWVWTIVNAIKSVLWPILIVVCAAGMIYAVILGVNMARADSTDKREEAKKRLINVLVGLAIIVALILFFQLCIDVILPAVLPEWQQPTTPSA
jgi:cell division protein FtsW (lipid II flippase)